MQQSGACGMGGERKDVFSMKGESMQEVTREEFADRIMALQRARQIFIESGLTDNITTAFETYQDLLAGRERVRKISMQPPNCECGSPMLFRQVGPNDEGIKIQLVCTNMKCDTVLNSEHDMAWWAEQLIKGR